MTKLYLVYGTWNEEYPDEILAGVYSTEENAKEAQDKLDEKYQEKESQQEKQLKKEITGIKIVKSSWKFYSYIEEIELDADPKI